MKKPLDFVIVGSGINSLCCAALLAKQGNRVCVVERNDYLGGCIKTEEITLPGFRHDVLSGFHPLFVSSPAYQELRNELARHGLRYVNTDKPTAVITSSGKHCILTTDRKENIAAFNAVSAGDGDAYAATLMQMEQDADFIFGLLGSELMTFAMLKLVWKEFRKRGVNGLQTFFGDAMDSSRGWLTKHFKSDLMQALLAPWVLHTGLGPDANFSGAMNRVIAFSLENVGMPIVKGGSDQLVKAFQALIAERNGELLTGCHVSKVLVEKGVAKGVRLADGNELPVNKAVICNVTPQQLYLSLLDSNWVPETIQKEAEHYQFGRADMQIHLALDRPPQWCDSKLNQVAMIHLSDGINDVARAVSQAERGLLPEHGTIVVAQPTALDPSRAPEGKAILWLQLQELPSVIKGDAAGQIAIPADGCWNEQVKQQYADRIIARLARHIPGLHQIILARTVLSPMDLQRININLVGGDPYSGHCGMQQFFAWRPLKSLRNHQTTVKNLYHIGASTHPGPGLGGNSGYMVAKAIG